MIAALLSALLLVGVAVPAALFTRLGVYLVGHHYWLGRAASATSATATDACLRRVLGSTQYGVNQAESFIMAMDQKSERVRLWKRLVALAPNDNWRNIYQRRLAKESGAAD